MVNGVSRVNLYDTIWLTFAVLNGCMKRCTSQLNPQKVCDGRCHLQSIVSLAHDNSCFQEMYIKLDDGLKWSLSAQTRKVTSSYGSMQKVMCLPSRPLNDIHVSKLLIDGLFFSERPSQLPGAALTCICLVCFLTEGVRR